MEVEVLVVVSSGSKPENVNIIDNFIIFEHYKLLSWKLNISSIWDN
jgi:hypothetical protein